MDLTTLEKQELSLLSGYFKKLEMTANHLGVDLDDYINEFRDNGYAKMAAKMTNPQASGRKSTFEKASQKQENTKKV